MWWLICGFGALALGFWFWLTCGVFEICLSILVCVSGVVQVFLCRVCLFVCCRVWAGGVV